MKESSGGEVKNIFLIKIPQLWVSFRIYNGGSTFGVRCLSSCKDRYAIDFGVFSIIIEMWFLGR
jgi:hypothetical protein